MKSIWKILLVLFLSASACSSYAKSILGFDLSNANIPINEIRRGGPPPDGIPSIDGPNFIKAGSVDYLEDEDVVIGFSHGGVTKAYPFRILIWHEIVNDTVGGQPVAVVYCPLCGSAMVFDRRYNGNVLTFGVSGLLFNSDVLMFDRQSRSLWSQLGLKAVSGDYAGETLKWLPGMQMSWRMWRERYPESQVLNLQTGYRRDYSNLPYQDYFKSRSPMFSYNKKRNDLKPKAWIAGVQYEGTEKAYPLKEIPPDKWIDDSISGSPVRFRYDERESYFTILDGDGNELPVVHAFWFSWQAFYPETELWAP